MEEWKEYNLGQLVELKNGVAFKSSEFIEKGIPVIKIKNVKPNRILLDDLSFVSYKSSLNKKCFDIRPTDILITMTGNRKDGGADSWVGKVALFNHTGRYLLNQRVSAIRVKDNSLVDNVYLSYLLSGWDAQLYFVNHSNSSGGQANISPDIVYNYAVSLPPLSVQYKISSILKSLDDKIEVNRKINENLEQQAQALFKSWFVDFEPFKDGEFVESELGMIPKGWRVGKLGELCQFKRGKNLLSKNAIPGDVPVVAGGLEPACYHNVSNTKAPVITVSGSGANAGFMRMYYQEVWASDCSFIDVTCENWLFVYCFLAINSYLLKHAQTGAVQPHVKPADIHDFDLVIPPIETIQSFQNIILSFISKKGLIEQESRRLANIRDTLLPKLMSGELKVMS